MLRLASDADVHGPVVERLIEAGVDLVRVVDALAEGTEDPVILEWAVAQGRVLLTNDESTMIGFAWERVKNHLPMTGLVVMPPHYMVGTAIQDVQIIAEVCEAEELRDQVIFLPLQPGVLRNPRPA